MTKRWLVALFLMSGFTLAPAASPALEPGTLTGVVTDQDGRALAGIPLWALRRSPYGRDEQPPSAFSGPDGSFAISGLLPGAIDLYACGPGYVDESMTVWFRDEPVHLEMQAAAILRGRVLGPDGTPVVGALLDPRESPVILLEDDTIFSTFPETSPPCPDARSATSDEDGRFELASLPPGRYRLDTFAEGMTTNRQISVRLAEGEAREGLEIRLQGDGGREGRLIDPAGALVDSAPVTFSDQEGRSATAWADDGVFRFVPPGGPVTFKVEAKGYETFERTIELAEPDETPVELHLVRDGSWTTVRGRVIGDDGRPLEGAEIFVVAEGVAAHTAADGSFEIQRPRHLLRPLVVVKDGFDDARVELGPDLPVPEKMTVRLEPGTPVTVRVRGLTPGDRNQEIEVSLSRGDKGYSTNAVLQADDTFRIENVPPGRWKAVVEAAYRSASAPVTVKPGQREARVEVVFPRLVPVSGRVLDSTGQPAAGAEISAIQDDEEVDRSATRRDGSFALNVPKGKIRLTVTGTGARGSESREVEIPVGRRAVKGVAIRLEPEPNLFFTATGHVLGLAPGQEFEIVGILDTPDHTLYSRATFEGDGYTLSLEPGAWDLQGLLYDAQGTFLRKVRWKIDIPPGSTEKELDLDLASAQEIPEEP